jgi:enoyl-CoA hydratase/carnithine racemase
MIPSAEAHRIGLVNEVVPKPDLMSTAERWAAEILECSPFSSRLSTEAVIAGQSLPVEDAIKQDRERLQRMRAPADSLEGARAFAEKRKPKWTGR